MDRFAVISGCPGGGKSTLFAELKWRGYEIIEEPDRRRPRSGAGSTLSRE
ncbi:AAA family ATPase [Methylocystis parvus]|uniref:AAA family ATPase n=2 Tax=Methylocystis parvus TaxID=134 RepID=A0A6B8M566_9HYPH|nr:AAA family ATPase [Methylocystis parvus]